MSAPRIAIGGSSANPPHRGHLALVHALLGCGRFDRVRWDVCGQRPDKADLIAPGHRVAMALLAFAPVYRVVHTASAFTRNTPTVRALEEARAAHPGAEIVWYTGVDVLVPQEQFGGRSEVEATWVDGERFLHEWPCVVLPRAGYPHPRTLTLPRRTEIIDVDLPAISSSEVRRRIAAGEPFAHLIAPYVAQYIEQHRLYGWA